MLAKEALHLKLYEPIKIIGYTYKLKKNMRRGHVLDIIHWDYSDWALVKVLLPDGRIETFDSWWIHTNATLDAKRQRQMQVTDHYIEIIANGTEVKAVIASNSTGFITSYYGFDISSVVLEPYFNRPQDIQFVAKLYVEPKPTEVFYHTTPGGKPATFVIGRTSDMKLYGSYASYLHAQSTFRDALRSYSIIENSGYDIYSMEKWDEIKNATKAT